MEQNANHSLLKSTPSNAVRIDAHQHFWKFDPIRDAWITDDMAVIQKDFMPADLEVLLKHNNIDGCVLVQADQSEEHNHFMLELSAKHNFIKGVVGWIELQADADTVLDRLSYYKQYPVMKGFRHVLQGETDRALMLKPNFMRGIGLLKDFGYTYDILVFADQLKYVTEFVNTFPDQKFVIDHIAKPNIRKGEIDEWRKDIMSIGACENVWCKISGMVTEADWKDWTKQDFAPYIDVVAEAFGPGRIMFASDWPVCLVAASYGEVLAIVHDYFAEFTTYENAAFFGGNASNFYNL